MAASRFAGCLLPVRGQDHDLVLHLALQQVQPLPDAVQADQVLDTGLGDRRAQIRVFGDELCGGCPRGLDPVLLSGEFGLLAGEQDLHADVRADRTEPAALLVRGPHEGHLAEAVEAAADLFLGHFQATGEIGHTVARIRQHRTVYGFRLSLHTQRSQHARPP